MKAFLAKLLALVRKPADLSSDLRDELESHLEFEIQERIDRGMTSEEARLSAARAFGNPALIAESARDSWSWLWFEHLKQDLSYAVRMLWRSPGFTLTAALVLSIGIGANLAMLHLFNAAFFHRLAIRDADSILGFQPYLPVPMVAYYRDHNSVFAYVVAERNDGVFPEDELEAETTTFVSASYFSDLGVNPALGRMLDQRDADASAPSVVVLSHRYWQRHFGGDLSIVGRSIRLNGNPLQVVGVTPRDFNGLSSLRPSMFLPMKAHPQLFAGSNITDFSQRGTQMFAKLKPGTSLSAAEGQLAAMTAELQKQHPNEIGSREAPIGSRSSLPREALTILSIVTLLVSLVLAAACANLGNLLLARGQFREREIAIRLGLGAGPWRIVRQLMVENLVLAVLGCAAGLLVGYITARVLLIAGDAPPEMHVTTDWRIVLSGCILGLFSLLVFGLAPALQAVRRAPAGARARQVLIAVQVGASCFLLIMAAMLVRSANQSLTPDVRFDYRHMIVIEPELYKHGVSGAAASKMLDDIASRVLQKPGVSGVTLSASPIFGDRLPDGGAPGLPPMAYYKVASSYFSLMNLSLLRGRLFSEKEKDVIVLSESAAHAIWPNEDPLGKQVETRKFNSFRAPGRERRGTMLRGRASDLEQRTVVGVVRDSRDSHSAEAYVPLTDENTSTANLIVRTNNNPAAVIREARSAASSPGVAPAVSLMRTEVEQNSGPPPGVLLGVGSLAGGATLLAGFGIFGLIAFAVAQRTREIGVRMALGARPSHIVQTLVARYSSAMGIGAVAGVLLAVIFRLLIRTIINGLRLQDPMNDIIALAILAAVALFAILVPAARALRIDPAAALRWD
jgi:predicted permease